MSLNEQNVRPLKFRDFIKKQQPLFSEQLQNIQPNSQKL
jgi:hypothetical protein